MLHSFTKAKYLSMASITCEIVYLLTLIVDFQIYHSNSAHLYCYNITALHITANLVFHEPTKHIELDCHFIRDNILFGTIKTFHVHSHQQLVDVLTKALCNKNFNNMIANMRVLSIYSPS